MASRGPLGHRARSTQRGLQPRAVRGENSLETVSLHAIFKSALVQAAQRVNLPKAALQSRWPAPSR
eukprot:5447860-Prymnesium_polylepis.1